MQTAPRIGAIETEYAGVRFRSRLEARWAVFFDALGLKWEHEPEAYTDGTTWYTPDFWLPELELFWEVKPNADYDRTKPKMLVEVTGSEIVVSTGSPAECRGGDLVSAVGGLEVDHWIPWEVDDEIREMFETDRGKPASRREFSTDDAELDRRKSRNHEASRGLGLAASQLSAYETWLDWAVKAATACRFWEPGQSRPARVQPGDCRPPKITPNGEREDRLVSAWLQQQSVSFRRAVKSVMGHEGSIVIALWNWSELPPYMQFPHGGADMADGDWFSYHLDNNNSMRWLRCAS